jgi:hypothetical protein
MEYAALMTAYSSTSSMFWTGYAAFFAVNTLLATAFGFSYSQVAAGQSTRLISAVRLGLPLIGMAMAVIAIHAAWMLRTHQKLIIGRGKEIDQSLATRSFTLIGPEGEKRPVSTSIGALLFLLAWAIAAYLSY